MLHAALQNLIGRRFYDPEIGVWTSTDPAEQDWSGFSYCFGDPINNYDPDGAETYYNEDGSVNCAMAITNYDDPSSFIYSGSGEWNQYEVFSTLNVPDFAGSSGGGASPPYAIWSAVTDWSVNQYVNTGNPVFFGTGVVGEMMKSIVPQAMNDWGMMTGGIKMIGGYPMPADFHMPRTGTKATILRDAGDYQGRVGKNPDIDVRNGKIILKGTGSNKGKSYQTDLDPSWYFNQ